MLSIPDWPAYDEREIEAVTRVIESRKWWRIIGSEAATFEQEFARYQGGAAALAVTNGTQAIELVLQALDIGRGDEVLVPAFTFISTATAVLNVNAVPVFVDVDPDTYCMDPAALEAAITPRTRAIIPVHMAGHVADMDAIQGLASRRGLAVIEDAAHAHGADWSGRRVGALAEAGIFSFQSGKLMTAGEGGLVLSRDRGLIERCFLYSSCGRPQADRSYQHVVLGTNARLSELQAAVLRVQLERLDRQIAERERNAALLDAELGAVAGLTPQGRDPRVTRHPHYMYMFRYAAAEFGGLPRQQFVDQLVAQGIPAFVAYPAVPRTPVFRDGTFGPRWRKGELPDYSRVSCPVSEELGDTVVWLHHRTLLAREGELQRLVEAVQALQAPAVRTVAVR